MSVLWDNVVCEEDNRKHNKWVEECFDEVPNYLENFCEDGLALVFNFERGAVYDCADFEED